MFSTSQLTAEQIETLKQWASDGAQLPDIQKRMEQEMEIRLTYMDTRFLVLDLGLEIKSPEEEKPAEPDPAPPVDPARANLSEDDLEILPPDQQQQPAGGSVHVSVDEIARPGVMISGRVIFPDGEGGMWYVDDSGQLGLDPDTDGYRPSETDLLTFQRELQRKVQ